MIYQFVQFSYESTFQAALKLVRLPAVVLPHKITLTQTSHHIHQKCTEIHHTGTGFFCRSSALLYKVLHSQQQQNTTHDCCCQYRYYCCIVLL